MEPEKLTKYEMSRILGARALQIAMNAPLLIKMSKDDLEKVNYDALKIAEIELDSGVLPIRVNRPLPEKKEEELKRAKEIKLSEKKKIELEKAEEKALVDENSEIMALAIPEDEKEEEPRKIEE